MPFDTKILIFLLIGGLIWLLLSYGTYRLFSLEPASGPEPAPPKKKEVKRVWFTRTLARRVLCVVFAPILWSAAILYVLGVVLYREGRSLVRNVPQFVSDTMRELHNWNAGRPMRKAVRVVQDEDRQRAKLEAKIQRRATRGDRVRARRARFLSGYTEP